jgi:hypothetical protein
MSNPGVKAGLVGAAVAVLLSLMRLVPCIGCIASILGLAVYVGAGVLAAYWLTPPRTTGDGAGAGAVAGVITALAGGVVSIIVGAAQFTLMGGPAAVMRNIPPESLRELERAGIDPRMFVSLGGIVGIEATCCVAGLVIAAVLGAIGGMIMASAKSN